FTCTVYVMTFISSTPNQTKSCGGESKKNAIARPKRKKINAKDGVVSKIQLIPNLHEISFLDEILHGHLALLEARIVFHPFTNPRKIIVSVHTKQLIAGKMIEQKRVDTHLIKFADRAGSQGIMLFLAEGKGFDRLFRILFHSFAKSSVVVCQIEELVDLVDTHLSLLQFPYGVARAVVVFQKQGPGFSHRAGEADPVQQLAAVVAGFIYTLFGGAAGQGLVFPLNQ